MKRPRLHGWPFFYKSADDKAVVEATAYYDMVNFASRIKCESVVTAGALDHTCSPCGVVSVYNAIRSENKTLLVHPAGEHIIPQIDSKFRAVFQNRFLELFNEGRK
jgi:cephalosporin-C deacetylase-like acetyl esterase